MADAIRIDKLENTGTINFYVGDSDKKKETISIAAVDRYSSPLECEAMISPFGQGYHRVSLAVTNPMIGQRVYEKYLSFKDESKAKDLMVFAVGVFNEMKKEAEVFGKHSSYILPLIWSKFSNLEADINYDDVIDSSISKRFNNKQFKSSDNPEPDGWVGKSLDPHFPCHSKGVAAKTISEIVGVPTRLSNSNSGLVKTSSCNSIPSKSLNTLLKLYR